MMSFALLATLLVVATLTRLTLPLLRRPHIEVDATERSAANLAIFRDQLAELEQERVDGSLSDPDFAQAKRELERRLLDEVRPENDGGRQYAPARRTALLVALIVPFVAVGGYALLGTPQGLDPAAVRPANQVTAQQIEGMVAKLAERLKQSPDDFKGWVMLARSYKVLGRAAEAADAYSHAMPLVGQDPSLLIDYAEAATMASGTFRGLPSELIGKALKLDASNLQVLLLAGAAANERGDFAAAVGYWEKVQPQIDANSEEGQALANAITEARAAAQAKGEHKKR